MNSLALDPATRSPPYSDLLLPTWELILAFSCAALHRLTKIVEMAALAKEGGIASTLVVGVVLLGVIQASDQMFTKCALKKILEETL